MADPLITVCTPVYNGALFVRETLDAVLGQTHPSLRYLVSVDLSTDDSLAICREYERDERVRIWAQPERLGWVGNTNFLLKRADAPFVAIMPHDDVPRPGWLERLLDALLARPDAVLAIPGTGFFGTVSRGPATGRPDLTGSRAERLALFLRTQHRAGGFRGLVARERLPAMVLLPHGNAADQLWLLALARHGSLVRVDELLVSKRVHSASAIASNGVERRMGPDPRPRWRGWLEHCVRCTEIALEGLDTAEREVVTAALQDRLLQQGTAFKRSEWARRLSPAERETLCREWADRCSVTPDLERARREDAMGVTTATRRWWRRLSRRRHR